MEKIINELKDWLNELKGAKLPEFDDLPDVSLYMDQIVSYVDSILSPYSRDEQKLITSFMVNNYVKAKIIDAPILKRYDKNQLSYLITICLLKQITSMSNMAVLLNKDNFNDENGEFYNHFINIHNEAKNVIHDKMVDNLEVAEKGTKHSSRIRKKKESEEPEKIDVKKNLIELSLKLMIESELNKMVAERILYELGKETYDDPQQLFEPKNTEIKFEKKVSKFETKRVKKVNNKKEKKANSN
jgi:hypothetical protein